LNIFITGIAGFLGSHLAKKLVSEGHNIFGNDNLIGGDLSNISEIRDKIAFIGCSNSDVLEKIKHKGTIDVLYHCACYPHEGLSVFSPRLITQSVYDESIAIFTWAIQNKVKKIVYLSSMARYGTQPVFPFTEDMTPNPQDPYGIAKVAVEQTLKVLSQVHEFEYTIAVPHNIYGPHQKYDDPFRNVAAIMINRILQGKPPIVYGDGAQTRCFSYIDDVIDPLVKLGEVGKYHGHIFNLGPDNEPIPVKELAEKIIETIEGKKSKTEIQFLPDRPQEVKHANCSADKARVFLKYKPKVSLKEGLKELSDWIFEKGSKPFNYHLPLEIINDKIPRTWSERIM